MDLAAKSKEAVAKRHSVGMVFQYPEHQLFEETVAKDIAFGPKNLGCSEEETEKRVKSAMKLQALIMIPSAAVRLSAFPAASSGAWLLQG